MRRILSLLCLLMTLNAWSQRPRAAESFGYETMPIDGEAVWSGRVTASADPIVILQDFDMDADREKYLKMRLSLEGAQSVQVFFSAGESEPFSEARSFRAYGWKADGQWHDYTLNLNSIEAWRGPVHRLRVDLEGAPHGAMLHLGAITAHAQPVEADFTLAAFSPSAEMHDRMAAHNEIIVATNTAQPNSALLSQIHPAHSPFHQALLARIVPGIQKDNVQLWTDQAQDVHVEDYPGGVRARFRVGDSEVMTEWMPLFVGAETIDAWDGAALYHVFHSGEGRPVMRVGGSGIAYFHSHPVRVMVGTDIPAERCAVDIRGDRALLTSTDWPLSVVLRAPGAQLRAIDGSYLEVTLREDGGDLFFAYAEEEEKALAILEKDITVEADRVRARYQALLDAAYIQTPDADMNAAFRSAIQIMEYAWLPPYGWTESIHHWLSLWHNQHSPAAEWLGQEERSRQCIVAHADNLMPDGAVPQFSAGGHIRRDFGGSNQFYFHQVRHYLRHTADLETLRAIAPALDAILEQTWREYDPDNDGLLAWGKQIGNQEDFISTPYNGAVPTIEGINMLETRALVAEALGDGETARRCRVRAAAIQHSLRREFWMPELGRFACYKDPNGALALEGAYQAFLYPVIYGLCDSLDAWTGLRHFRDRLVSEQGRAYCSNHFASHADGIHATWGMQGGAAQQPWAAWSLAAAGLRNEAWLPLRNMARWAMNDMQRGAWPEVAEERRMGYFSPPAALYVQAMIEAVFGLSLNRLDRTLEIAPAFPDAWPRAELKLPGFQVAYERDGKGLMYDVQSDEPLTRLLRWKLPPCRGIRLRVNGAEHEAELLPGVGCMELSAEIALSTRTEILVELDPLEDRIEQPGSLAVGETLALHAVGVRILGIEDPDCVLDDVKMSESEVVGRVRSDALDRYVGFGPLGGFTFSRRTVFLLCEAPGGATFRHPVDFALLPPFEIRPLAPLTEDGTLRILTRNNTGAPLDSETVVRVAGRNVALGVHLGPRSEQAHEILLPPGLVQQLPPGDNPARWIIASKQQGVSFSFAVEEVDALRWAAHAVILPDKLLVPDNQWADARPNYAWYHAQENHPPLLAGLPADRPLAVSGLPGVAFEITPGKIVPVSRKSGQPCVRIPLEPNPVRKVYLLVAGLLENHDMYLPIARVSVRGEKPKTSLLGEQYGDPVVSRVLHYPGDLDSFYPNHLAATMFSTVPYEQRDRFFLAPLLQETDSDWSMARPPQFPQPALWSQSRVVSGTNAHCNIIEMDLGQRGFHATEIEIEALTNDAAIALLAVTLLVDSAEIVEDRSE